MVSSFNYIRWYNVYWFFNSEFSKSIVRNNFARCVTFYRDFPFIFVPWISQPKLDTKIQLFCILQLSIALICAQLLTSICFPILSIDERQAVLTQERPNHTLNDNTHCENFIGKNLNFTILLTTTTNTQKSRKLHLILFGATNCEFILHRKVKHQ